MNDAWDKVRLVCRFLHRQISNTQIANNEKKSPTSRTNKLLCACSIEGDGYCECGHGKAEDQGESCWGENSHYWMNVRFLF